MNDTMPVIDEEDIVKAETKILTNRDDLYRDMYANKNEEIKDEKKGFLASLFQKLGHKKNGVKE